MKTMPTSPALPALALALGLAFAAPLSCAAPASVSAFQQMPDDPKAVVVRAKGDGVADDSAAIQQAIDQAANKGEGGLVFLPAGRYRITRSILIPLAVRVYGVGKTRPVFVLAPSTPGSAITQTSMAQAATASSTIMPAAPTTARCHRLRKATAAEASTKGTG